MWLCRLKRLLLCFFSLEFAFSLQLGSALLYLFCVGCLLGWQLEILRLTMWAKNFPFILALCKSELLFFLGNSLSTTSQFQCSAFFFHRKSVIHFVFVICNQSVCISIKWWTKKSNRIKRTPHSYTEPHTQTPNEPKAKARRVRKMPKGKGGCKSKIKGLQFLFVFLCARLALFRWISLFSVWWLCPLCLCNGNRLSVYV